MTSPKFWITRSSRFWWRHNKKSIKSGRIIHYIFHFAFKSYPTTSRIILPFWPLSSNLHSSLYALKGIKFILSLGTTKHFRSNLNITNDIWAQLKDLSHSISDTSYSTVDPFNSSPSHVNPNH